MYERRLEHSLYKTLAELQRLRLMRQIDPPHDNAPNHSSTHPPSNSPTHHAKQTQFPEANSSRNHCAASHLYPNTPASHPSEQTQSPRSKDRQRRGGYPKNRCENTTRRLIVETEAPPVRKPTRRDTRTPRTKGNVV
jgi:hypothetical protein